MKQEEKNLLIGVLAALLPYEIKVQVCNITDYTPVLKGIIGDEIFVQFDYARPIKNGDSTYNVIKDNVKPYLRPMSSMTEEERNEYNDIYQCRCHEKSAIRLTTLCYSHHLDINGLIEKGLAIEAPKDMYKF